MFTHVKGINEGIGIIIYDKPWRKLFMQSTLHKLYLEAAESNLTDTVSVYL